MGKHDSEQVNKKHNQMRQKLKKRQERKKQAKKRHKEKKQAKIEALQLRRQKGQIDLDKAKRIIRSLVVEKGGECLLKLPDIFGALDDGYGIELDGLKDPFVKHKLKKLAKALLLQKKEVEDSDGETKVQYRKSELKINLTRTIERIIDRVSKQSDSSQSSASGEESDHAEEEKKQEPEVIEEEDEFVGPAIPDTMMVKLVNSNPSQDFLNKTESLLEKETKGLQKKSDKGLNDTIKSIFSGDYKTKETKRPLQPVVVKQQTSFRRAAGYGSARFTQEQESKGKRSQEEEQRDDFLRAYMNEYNSMYRPKSLREEYSEIQHHTKKSKGKSGEDHRAIRKFNREDDMNFGMVDSTRTFNTIHGKGSLSDKFGGGSKHFL